MMKKGLFLTGAQIIGTVFFAALLSGGVISCTHDDMGDRSLGNDEIGVELNIITRSMNSDNPTYEAGAQWENYIDITAGDYKIYFFTNDKNDATATSDSQRNTLIAEFVPKDIDATDKSEYMTYSISGEVGDDIVAYSDFKVVVLANWGAYPEVTAGKTTIDDLVEGENSTFIAETFFNGVDATHLIPFYGVHEYSNVKWTRGWRTTLERNITLLRALSKVEVILRPNGSYEDFTFDDVSIVNYNKQGYCAPSGVYLKGDYDHDYTWSSDFVDGLHLVNKDSDGNEINDADDVGKTFSLRKIKEKETDASGNVTQYETWVAYLPEYRNMGDDYSYLSIRTDYLLDNDDYRIYFANYSDGVTTAYRDGEPDDRSDRYDIYRNYLYRFYVTFEGNELYVEVETWENVFDNNWSFGEYSHLIYADDDINNFTGDDGYIYASLVEEGDEDNPTVYLQKVSATTTGYVRVPDTVTYLGYTYTVVGIGSYAFDADQYVTFIDIPETVTYIETEAFHGDIGLEGIAVHSEIPPDCAEDAFDGDDLDAIILYVPTNAVEAYSTTSPWSSFTNIVGIDFVN